MAPKEAKGTKKWLQIFSPQGPEQPVLPSSCRDSRCFLALLLPWKRLIFS